VAAIQPFVLGLLFIVALPAAAQEIGTVTIVDGQPAVLRGALRLLLAEGAILLADDIVETGEAGFVQVESPGGVALGIGPKTRLFADAQGMRTGAARVTPYLLEGWVKLSVPKSLSRSGLAGALRLPRAEITDLGGTVVVQAAAREVRLFSESGAVQVREQRSDVPADRDQGAGRVPVEVKAGQFYVWTAGSRSRVQPRPDATFMAAMPVIFRDTLPPRLDKLSGRKIALRPGPALSYPDIGAWLAIDDPAIRRRFVQRYAPRLEDPQFRRSVAANITSHPEWYPVLYPGKGAAGPESGASPTRPAPGYN
jgi:hypothetical protein